MLSSWFFGLESIYKYFGVDPRYRWTIHITVKQSIWYCIRFAYCPLRTLTPFTNTYCKVTNGSGLWLRPSCLFFCVMAIIGITTCLMPLLPSFTIQIQTKTISSQWVGADPWKSGVALGLYLRLPSRGISGSGLACIVIFVQRVSLAS